MKRLSLAILLGALLSICGVNGGFHSVSPANAQETVPETAPFGLKWGMSVADVERLGVKLDPQGSPSESFGPSYLATNVPKVLKDIAGIIVSFDYNGRLWRVSAVSENFENDAYGRAIRDRYQELGSLLNDRYGKGQEVNGAPSDDFFSQSNNFVYSLYRQERQLFTDWRITNTAIQLSVRAAGTSSAYYHLIYEYTPFKADVTKKAKQREKDAL